MQNRTKARIVGWIDLILLLLLLLGAMWSAAILAPISPALIQADDEKLLYYLMVSRGLYESHHVDSPLIYFGVKVAVQCIVTTIQIGTAIFLINSTSNQVNPQTSLKMALFWFTINFLVILFYIIWRILLKFWIVLCVGLIYRAVVMYHVADFLFDLRRIATVNRPVCEEMDAKVEIPLPVGRRQYLDHLRSVP